MDQFRLLVVEDNPINRKLALAMLAHLGYKADTAGNGQEAVIAHSTQAYDIILMDCHMPVLDGLEATRQIRSLELETGTSRCQIVAVTGDVLSSDHQRCLEAGMDLVCRKPYRLDNLRDAIGQAMARHGVVFEQAE